MIKNKRGLGLLLTATLVVSAAGCAASTTKVTGKVTYQNKPVTGGVIMFTPVSGKATPIPIDLTENGEFEATVPTGEVRITIDNRNLMTEDKGQIGASGDYSQRVKDSGGGPPRGRPGMAGGGGRGGPAQMPQDEKTKRMLEERGAKVVKSNRVGTYMKIPAKYYKSETTDLIMTIKKGDVLNLELKD